MSEVKDKKKLLKAAREKLVIYISHPHKSISRFFSRNCTPEGVAKYIPSAKRKKTSDQDYSTWQTSLSEVKER